MRKTSALTLVVLLIALTPGTLVPQEALTSMPDVVKPRSLFGPDEDWSKALLYY